MTDSGRTATDGNSAPEVEAGLPMPPRYAEGFYRLDRFDDVQVTIDGFVDLATHAEYTITVSEAAKVVARTRQRYSNFLPLHESIAGPLELSSRFPVPKAFFNSSTGFKLSRAARLQAYLNAAIAAAANKPSAEEALDTLDAFIGRPPPPTPTVAWPRGLTRPVTCSSGSSDVSTRRALRPSDQISRTALPELLASASTDNDDAAADDDTSGGAAASVQPRLAACAEVSPSRDGAAPSAADESLQGETPGGAAASVQPRLAACAEVSPSRDGAAPSVADEGNQDDEHAPT